jgi:hypothetical protein
MRKIFFATIALFLFSFSCKAQLQFSLKNATDISIKDIEVGLPDTTLHFSSLNNMSKTDWVNVKSAYRYGYLKFKDNQDRTYKCQPIDYVGEKLYKNGYMTFIIKTIDKNTGQVYLISSIKKDE